MWFSGFLPELTISSGLGRHLISRHTPQAICSEGCRAAGIFCAPGNPPKNGGPLLPLHHLKFLKGRFRALLRHGLNRHDHDPKVMAVMKNASKLLSLQHFRLVGEISYNIFQLLRKILFGVAFG